MLPGAAADLDGVPVPVGERARQNVNDRCTIAMKEWCIEPSVAHRGQRIPPEFNDKLGVIVLPRASLRWTLSESGGAPPQYRPKMRLP